MWTRSVAVPALLVAAGVLMEPAAALKTWLHNTDWANAANWAGGRVPCAGDRVELPAQLTAAVRLPEGDTTVRELVLPLSGELILPSSGALLLATGDTPGCPGEDVVFSRLEEAAWLNEKNWRPAYLGEEAAWAAGAVPHLERVPCSSERAVFPAGSSFLVRLPEVPVGVGAVVIDDQDLDSGSWQQLLESEPGGRQFRSHEGWDEDAVKVFSVGCHIPYGCPCQRDALLPAICKYSEPTCTPTAQLPCLKPITPRGFCCPICGAYLEVEFDFAHFSAYRLKRLLQHLLPAGVVARVSIFEDLYVQVVLVETDGYSGLSVDAATAVAPLLTKAAVEEVRVVASGAALHGGLAFALLGYILGALAAVMLLMAVLFLLFVYSQGGSLHGDGRPFVFARFENVDQEDNSVSIVAPPPPEKAFDNPMYGKTGGDHEASASQEERKAALGGSTTYTELQSRVDAQELVDVDIGAGDTPASSDV